MCDCDIEVINESSFLLSSLLEYRRKLIKSKIDNTATEEDLRKLQFIRFMLDVLDYNLIGNESFDSFIEECDKNVQEHIKNWPLEGE